jgi:hypothetical protein
MNLLILGDRKPLNDSDLSFACFAEASHDVTFLYRGAPYPLPFGVAVDETNVVDQIRSIVRSRKIDILYFRVDWFDKLYTQHGEAILNADFGVPMVFGYHCHTCQRTRLESLAIERADALVLLNPESQAWIEQLYGVHKPTMLMPSLLLPRRAWYDVPLKGKKSGYDHTPHVVIPSNAIRLAGVPERLDPAVPIENYVIDRYDYYRLTEQLARRGVAVHLYGKFQVQGGTDASVIEAVYRDLAKRYPGFIHFEGRVDQREFATELSQYDGALLTGFVPYQPVPKFDHMNYQVRFNPVLAARLPSFVPAGTTSCGEREVHQSGAGTIFGSIDQLVAQLGNQRLLFSAGQAAHAAQERHSFEPWVEPLCKFFAGVKAAGRIRSSSRAA